MPPTRRSRASGGPAAKGAQKTISFGHKVTKPAPAPTTKEVKKTAPPPKPLEVDVGHVSSEAAVAQQAAVEIERVRQERSPEELRAGKVTDAQIKRYWREREGERRAPRVHQQGLSVEEKILRLFDMSSQYGVCF
jgi:DNA polymerase delta subunit 4